jgi:hypothetical protein
MTCHLNDAEKRQAGRQASKRAVAENQSSVTERSRHWGKAAAPNERRHHLVKFELKPVVYRQVRCHGDLTKKIKSRQNLNVVGLQQ